MSRAHKPPDHEVEPDKNSHPQQHSDRLFAPARFDPEHRLNVIQLPSLAEHHAEQHKQNSCLVEGLVHADVVVCNALELLDARLFVVACVQNPVLRHVPAADDCVVVNDGKRQQRDHQE
jgi:hypothetical protein